MLWLVKYLHVGSAQENNLFVILRVEREPKMPCFLALSNFK